MINGNLENDPRGPLQRDVLKKLKFMLALAILMKAARSFDILKITKIKMNMTRIFLLIIWLSRSSRKEVDSLGRSYATVKKKTLWLGFGSSWFVNFQLMVG